MARLSKLWCDCMEQNRRDAENARRENARKEILLTVVLSDERTSLLC